jgi:hypothetical protein
VSAIRVAVAASLCGVIFVLAACQAGIGTGGGSGAPADVPPPDWLNPASPRVIVGVDASHVVITEPLHEVIPSPRPDDATLAVALPSVDQRQLFFGIEGGYLMVRATDADGSAVVDRRVMGDSIPLPPGDYLLSAYVRNCDGNCSLLDGPQELCSVPAVPQANLTYELTVTVGSGEDVSCAFSEAPRR